MDFFTKPDWFNRPGPYAFRIEHLLFIAFVILVAVGLSLLLRRKNKSTIRKVLIGLWIFAVVIEIAHYAVLYSLSAIDPANNPFILERHLPLHSCTFFMYIFPFAMFMKNKYIKTAALNFLVGTSMIMAFITMFVGCPASLFSFFGMETLVYHGLIFIIPFVMVFTNYYDLQKGDLKYGLILFGLLSLTMWTFDAIAGCDYFYIYDGRTFGILYEISENVPHIVWTLITVTCYILTAIIINYLIIGIKYLIKKKQAKREETPLE